MAITELDEIRAQNAFDMIDSSTLEPKTKSELKESVAEAKQNLNGRSLEERCASIARNQFDTTRLLASLMIQSRETLNKLVENENKTPKEWKDVIAECRWAIVTLGSIIAISAIFSENIVELFKAVSSLFF